MNSKLLREKRASDYAIMEDLQKRAAGEGRLMNAEELAQWDAADANFKNGPQADMYLMHQWIKNDPVDLIIGNTYGK